VRTINVRTVDVMPLVEPSSGPDRFSHCATRPGRILFEQELVLQPQLSKGEAMKIMRVYAGTDGQSHFDEIEVETDELQPRDGIVFRHVPSDYINNWHRAPRRQYVINLSGES
jgi:hypothetical protein